jgi:hypothetical protein
MQLLGYGVNQNPSPIPPPKNKSKSPGDDSNSGLLPTAHQRLRTNGRPPQGKQQKVVKANEINPHLMENKRKITLPKVDERPNRDKYTG